MSGDLEAPPSAPATGESLSAYLRRVIKEDQRFTQLQASARGFRCEVGTPPSFRPSYIKVGAVAAFYAVLDRSKLDPRVEGFDQILDHLWTGRHPRVLPLDLRMVDVPYPAISPLRPSWNLDLSQVKALAVSAKAGRRRDFLLATLCDHLRSGEWMASGYLPGDHTRIMQPIAPAWWADDFMECAWQRAEFRPVEGAPPGMPTFLGVDVSPSTACPSLGSFKAEVAVTPDVRAMAWMELNVTSPKQWKREDAIAACCKELAVPVRTSRAAWMKLNPSLRGARGEHK